ncbi:outer membrane beta-barrel protein [Sediminibacterium ginsengisoli]|uniref:Carboxypeptidase regulatory-like domain-containing protein n=1 Tax=Sediminibacterium ginsengisoli TaxID=413434 RepID=A0A1T4L839_9BACT|nr:outer membrane beta-barrel protein [Sediminibacterium ginsengisoli]SJZ50895.1 Carboxypeptidase regulatory-like domain-containing protein [Sediminibacterium ginsengisoli]
MKIISLVCFLFLSLAAWSSSTDLSGEVKNARQQPLPYAVVSLLQRDGKILKGTLTDSSGKYEYRDIPDGNYVLTVSLVGYADHRSDTIRVKAGTGKIQLPPVILKEAAEQLRTVTVAATKKLFDMQPDKMVMNIENSPLATGNMAFDLLRKAPAVTTDKDDNIRLNGAACRIFIDGKPAYLSGTQLTEYLKNLPADMVSRIEIISNPSSKYEAEGTAGIINIRLKKNQAYGLNGIVNAGTGYGEYPKANGGLSVNYRKNGWNLFGSGSGGYSESFNLLNYNSIVRNNGTVNYQDRENYWHPVTRYSSFKAGADLQLGRRSTIGVLMNGNLSNTNAQTDNLTTFSNGQKQAYSYISSIRNGDDNSSNFSYNLNFKTELDTLGSDLNLDADYAVYNRSSIETNENFFTNAAGTATRSPYIFRNDQPAGVKIWSFKADHTRMFRNKMKMEVGVKFSWVTTDNNLIADSLQNGSWKQDISRTNKFIYDENINAAYLNLSRRFGSTAIQIGVRAEQTISKGNSITMNRIDERNYWGLFPSLFISQPLDSNNQLNLSYTRRINRPGYQSLNPFTWYVDPFTIFAGNPFLQPSFSHSFELKHGYKQAIFTSLVYRHATAVQTTVIRQDKVTGTVTNTTENANASDYLGLNVSASIPFTTWWSSDNNLGMAYVKGYSAISDFSYNQESFAASLYTSHTFKLKNDFRIMTDIYYSIPTREGLSRMRSSYSWGLALQKQVWQQKGTIRLNFTNIIGPSAYRSHIVSDELDITWKNQWEGRRINLNFAWKFGNMNVKASRNRNTGVQAEKNRVNL